MARKRDEAAHAATRARILQTAATLFAERGFHGTGMAAICEAVGMSPGTLYRYFDSKNAIVLAFVEDELQASLQLMSRLDGVPDLLDGLVDVVDEAIASSLDPDYVAVATEIAAEASRNPEIGEPVAAMQTQVADDLSRAIARGQDTGQVDPAVPARAAAAALLALVDGSVSTSSAMASLSPTERRELLDTLIRRLLLAR